jgi:hypothetical protein
VVMRQLLHKSCANTATPPPLHLSSKRSASIVPDIGNLDLMRKELSLPKRCLEGL